ncbi:MAG TPA: T9SS type A sorting domain-containing protein [Ignavibacteria bacterium]|nr:T9SS type A sorting domain-containing protein [Ignavibacteria bacterium]HMQ98172.1 T9SS type A sorting domain-containing protein [Ignavibacteria bacterium]
MIKTVIAALLITVMHISAQWVSTPGPTTADLKRIHFVNSQTGYMINQFWMLSTIIYKTTNSGLTWDSTSIPDPANDIFFINENTGWLAGGSATVIAPANVWKTTNGGALWFSAELIDSINCNSVYFADALTGFVTANGNDGVPHIFKSTDGGIQWNEITGVLDESNFIHAVFFTDPNTGWFTAKEGTGNENRNVIFRTTNSGSSWIKSNFPGFFGAHVANLHNIQFLNPNTGYVGGYVNVWYKGGVPFPKFFSTTNGGMNWIDLEIPEIPPYMHYLLCMHFINIDTGWIAGNRGNVLRTTNSGLNWELQYTGLPTNVTLYDLNYSEGNLWAAGRYGTLIKTTNGGVSVDVSVTGTIRYSDNGLPVTKGYVKAIKHSETGGELEVLDSVRIQPDGTYTLTRVPHDTIDLMAFDDDEISYSPSFVPTYYPSTIFWEDAQQIYTDSNLTDVNINVFRITNDLQTNISVLGGVYFNAAGSILAGIDNAILYARVGNIYRAYDITGNAGSYEIKMMPPGQYEIICSRMGYESKSRFVTVIDNNLTEINFYYGDLTPVAGSEEIPSAFSLSQNYPNPFNPKTKIKFSLPARSLAKLTVFDLLGKEVANLVNGDLNAGYYEYELDASNLSSGLYFYRFSAGNFTQTRKMIVLK